MISPTFNHMYALSCSVFLWRFAILWIVAHHAPLSMQFPRQKQWSGQPFPSLGYLPDPGIKPASPVSSVMATEFFTAEPPGKLFNHTMKMKVLVSQLCLTLCNPMECSLAGSSVHGILQARIVEWVAISYSRGSSWPRDQTQVSCIAGRFFTVRATREAPVFA